MESKQMCSPKPIYETNIGRFIEHLKSKYPDKASCVDSYQTLYKWSLENIPEFWEGVWNFSDIKCSKPYTRVIEENAKISDIPKWFEGSYLNYAEHALRWNDDHVALYAAKEGSDHVDQVTYAELRNLVGKYAKALKINGIVTGDRVVGYIPNCIEAVAAMLAASSLGAIWSSTSPDFGVSGVLDRFSQISPKVIFSTNAVRYNGKVYDHLQKLNQVVQGLPDLMKVVVINYVEEISQELSFIENSCWLDDFLAVGAEGDQPLAFEQLPFAHPLYIMYSSGTTGAPKCMVHSQGGTLMKHFEEHLLQGNLSRKDIMLYYTTTGWMMWNWLVGVLTVGGSCVLYDGSPLVPNANVLWDLVDKLGITILGTGAKWLAVLEDKGIKPAQSHKLTSLHTILSTGSPLKPESYDYVYRDIKSDLLLGSITGGTDIVGCFAAQSCTVPVYRGEIQCRVLGCAMQCWDAEGNEVFGQSGELVVTKPFPSMPVFFWNDEDGSKYKNAYFSKYPDVWSHGDYCMVNPNTGGIWMLGRSDGTLNPNGVRFGSAEIYNIVESMAEVQDSLCVAQRNKDLTEERVVLFLKMANGYKLDADLLKKVQMEIRRLLSARHVPAVILETKDIPYTISGKKVEVAVRDTIAGIEVKHRAAFSNPESLDLYKDIAELHGF